MSPRPLSQDAFFRQTRNRRLLPLPSLATLEMRVSRRLFLFVVCPSLAGTLKLPVCALRSHLPIDRKRLKWLQRSLKSTYFYIRCLLSFTVNNIIIKSYTHESASCLRSTKPPPTPRSATATTIAADRVIDGARRSDRQIKVYTISTTNVCCRYYWLVIPFTFVVVTCHVDNDDDDDNNNNK